MLSLCFGADEDDARLSGNARAGALPYELTGMFLRGVNVSGTLARSPRESKCPVDGHRLAPAESNMTRTIDWNGLCWRRRAGRDIRHDMSMVGDIKIVQRGRPDQALPHRIVRS